MASSDDETGQQGTGSTHFLIVLKRDGSMLRGYFNRRYDDRAYPESLIAADTGTGHLYEVVEVSESSRETRTYTLAQRPPVLSRDVDTGELVVHDPSTLDKPAQKAPITFQPGKWYVMDGMASTRQRAYVSGPFDTRTDAEHDRCQVNIAGDCDTWQCPDDRPVPCLHCGADTEEAPNGVVTASGTTGCAGSLHGHEVAPTSGLPVHGPRRQGSGPLGFAHPSDLHRYGLIAPFLATGGTTHHLYAPLVIIAAFAIAMVVMYRATRHLRPEVVSARQALRSTLRDESVDGSTDDAFVSSCASWVALPGESYPVRVFDVSGVL